MLFLNLLLAASAVNRPLAFDDELALALDLLDLDLDLDWCVEEAEAALDKRGAEGRVLPFLLLGKDDSERDMDEAKEPLRPLPFTANRFKPLPTPPSVGVAGCESEPWL